MTEKPTVFVLGLGAQKAGTSWLYDYLVDANHSNMGFIKEYHVWDVRAGSVQGKFAVSDKTLGEDAKSVLRYAMQRYDGFYEKYFASLVRDNKRLTGDITPTYSTLSADILADIRDRIQGVGFSMRTVLLLRDPVDRCWSAVRMRLRNAGVSAPSADEANTLFAELYASPGYAQRTSYRKMIETAESVFGDGLYLGLYETMFEHENIRDLSRFLTVSFRPDYRKVKKNTSPKTTLDPALEAACYDFYKDEYAYCNDRLPETKTHWRSH